MSNPELEQLTINTIRALSMDAVQAANSGHPGAPMGLAACAYTLWQRHLKHNPADPAWPNRDRFVLSNGHASMLLYSLLHLTGYEQMSLDQLRRFRQWGSVTAGHPESHLTEGVEMTTGPLGQGISTAVGMALAEAHLHARYGGVIDHFTYVICSDGDLMEGVSHEAAALAGHLGLGKLVCLWDDNEITIDGRTDLTFSEDVLARFEAYGWHVDRVEDGNDPEAVDEAIARARAVSDKPSLIAVETVIGYGSPNKADSSAAHGSPLGEDEVARTKAQLGWEFDEPFFVPANVRAHTEAAIERGAAAQQAWREDLAAYLDEDPSGHAELMRRLAGELPDGWEVGLPEFEPSESGMATRKASGVVLEQLFARLPELVGGSADLAGSNKTLFEQFGVVSRGEFSGQNVHFGVREHGMAAIANGMTLHGGVRGFGATFLIFSDYMRPALRLSALMETPSLQVFTHDSIGLGEDGPTHQPIEQLAGLRAIPNYQVLRPADANEVRECWRLAVAHREGPSCLVLTRQSVPTFDRAALKSEGDASRGGYVLADGSGERPDVILVGTGSEVAVCMGARELLEAEGISTRVVSLPCWEVFEAQGEAWQQAVLPDEVSARVAVEAASPMGWERWVGRRGAIVAMRGFGASAPAAVNFEKFGFTAEHVAAKARDVIDG